MKKIFHFHTPRENFSVPQISNNLKITTCLIIYRILAKKSSNCFTLEPHIFYVQDKNVPNFKKYFTSIPLGETSVSPQISNNVKINTCLIIYQILAKKVATAPPQNYIYFLCGIKFEQIKKNFTSIPLGKSSVPPNIK